MSVHPLPFFFFFFNDTATTEIYTLSLHDALPIYDAQGLRQAERRRIGGPVSRHALSVPESPDLRLELVRSGDRESGLVHTRRTADGVERARARRGGRGGRAGAGRGKRRYRTGRRGGASDAPPVGPR